MKKKIWLLCTLICLLFVGSMTVSAATFSLSQTRVTLNIGDSAELSVVGSEELAKWASYNVNIATVDQSGKVTAVRKGSTTISARIGLTYKKCTVTVVDSSIKVNKPTAVIYTGGTSTQTVQLRATVKGASKAVTWTSLNPAVATVDEKGKVTSVSDGQAVIMATANGKTDACVVKVLKNSISLNMDTMQLGTKGNGSAIKLTPTIVGTGKSVKWTTSDKTVATVSGGRVTGKNTGTAIITATANGVSATCEVTVIKDSLSISEEKVLLYTGETKQIRSNATGKEVVVWESSNDNVVTVDEKGKLTAVGEGTATIWISLSNAAAGTVSRDTTDTCEVTVKDSRMEIYNEEVSLKTKGTDKTCTLSYQVTGRKNTVKWTTSNSKVVSVSGGKLTAKSVGTATVTATANGVSDTVEVTVSAYEPTITLSQNEYTLYTKKGNTYTLRATIDGPVKKAVWESSRPEVATVVNGKVTAVGEGETIITATANDVVAECRITVKESKVILETENITMDKGATAQLAADVVGYSQSLSYASTNTKVVTVRNGVLTAKNYGEADIKVTANGVTSLCHVKVAVCNHEYDKVVTDPTCTEKGYTTYTCKKCGDSYTGDYTEPLGHEFGEWETVQEATEDEAGLEKRTCVRCDEEETREIPRKPHEHAYTETVTAPTCTEQGYTTHTCEKCGNSYVDTYTDALGHEFGEWGTVREATEEEAGLEKRSCKRCGEEETREIPKKEHEHVYTETVTAPTCAEKGYTTFTCKCGDSYVGNYTDALGHDFGEWETVQEATETETGLAKRSCKRCKEEETKVIPTTEHVHKYTAVVTAPTCTEKGYTTHTCACGDSYVDTETDALGHDYQERVYSPTCQNGGYTSHICRRCGYGYMDNITEPVNHSYVASTVEPTCEDQGYTLYTCSVCGTEYRDNYVDALGHDWGEWKVTKEATETETGEQVRICKRCNKEQTEEIPVKIHVHQYTSAVTTEPTCKQPGITTYTCTSCGHKYIDYVPAALGHDYVAKVVKEATCDDLGEVLYTCSRCGDSYTEQLDPLDHVFGKEVVTPPTCEKKGYTTRTCINCGHQIKDNYTDALGHEFGEWETVTEPTEDSMGLMKRQCIRCEETETKMIPALDHVHQYTDTVTAPTCTEKGYTTHTCKCGNSYVDTYTDALGHDYEDVVTEPTCTEKGSTTHTCKRCGYVCTDSETAALGHDYEDVVTEPTCGEQGYTTHTCKRCQDTYVDSSVDPTGVHDDGEWVVAKQPDVGVAGLKELRCTKCGYVLATEEIEMLTTDGVDSVYYIDVKDDDGTLRKEMVVGHYNREEAQEMLKFVNEYRASINQSTLKMTSETMNDYVDMRAAETSYLWDHTRPSGGTTSYAENIAQGNPDIKGDTPSVEQIFNAWLASEGHKANLDSNRDIYGLTGISVFYKKCPVYKDGKETGQYVYTAYWVEIFK